MESLQSVNETNKELNLKRIRIKDVSHIDEYLYLILDNGQKFLTNEKELYDLTDFGYVERVFRMGERLCAVVSGVFSPCLIDLNTKEILFQDNNAYSISKQDDRTLHVIKKRGNNTIYDIERKWYLPMPEDYEFENSLGNGLYVFCENNNNIPFYERKRVVINADGFFVLNNIKGWIYLEDRYLIIHKDQELTILEIGDDKKTKTIKKVQKNGTILTSPEYYNGKVITVLKDKINIYKPNLELIKSIPVEGLVEVKDSERICGVLKLNVPTIYNGEENGKHIFVNLETGKKIEHLRINGYPYWKQTSFVGQDELEDYKRNKPMDFYFYDKDFNFITKERGIQYYSADDENESLFIVENDDKNILINTENGSAKETDYILVRYHFSAPYGYGIHSDNKTMDFFDKNLDVIIPNFEFEKYNLSFNLGGFGYFIVNGYVCITTDFVDGYGRYQYRNIIYSKQGEVILDSIHHKCYPIGNFIQIMKGKDSKFLNTLTGEIGDLCICAAVDSTGKINLNRINNLSRQLILNDAPLIFESGEDSPNKKILVPNKE